MPFKPPPIPVPPLPESVAKWVQESQEPQYSSHIPGLLWQVVLNAVLPESTAKWLKGEYKGKETVPEEDVWNSGTMGDLFPIPMGGVAQIAERSGAKNLGAFLHRTIDPGEFGFLDWLAKKGKQSEAAASVITPTYRSIFHPSEPMPGVVFSVRNPENIRWWAPYDVWSKPEYDPGQPAVKARKRLGKIVGDRWDLDYLFGTKLPEDPESLRALTKYHKAINRIHDIPKTTYVTPGRDYDLAADEPLNRILSRQQRRLEGLARDDPNMEHSRFWELLNEVGYRMDPSEIVGVRVPRRAKKLGQADADDIAFWGKEVANEAWPGESVQVAIDFAKRHNLPIWQFTPQLRPGEAAHGIARYLGAESALPGLENYAPGPGQWYRRTTEEFPMGLVESTADPLAAYYGRELRR